MPNELASIKHQLAALQRLYQNLAEDHYDCDRFNTRLNQIESDVNAHVDRLNDLENIVNGQLSHRVSHNAREIRRYAALGVALTALVLLFFGMSSESRQKVSEESFAKVGSLVLTVGSGFLLLQKSESEKK